MKIIMTSSNPPTPDMERRFNVVPWDKNLRGGIKSRSAPPRPEEMEKCSDLSCDVCYPHLQKPVVQHRGAVAGWSLIGAGMWLFIGLIAYLLMGCTPTHAQGGPGAGVPDYSTQLGDPATFGPVYEAPPDIAEWFESQLRDDTPSDAAYGRASCCGWGDVYPIEILEDAYPPHTGTEDNGTAKVTDASARQIVIPPSKDWPHKQVKQRKKINDDELVFHFSGNKYAKEWNGNPTKTAWAYLNVSEDGHLKFVYCIVPLPPGF